MADLGRLIEQLGDKRHDIAIRAAHALGDLGDRRAVPPLIRLLDTTGDAAVRNAAAVGLHELADSRAIPSLLRQIQDPRNAGNRGTLVYALENMDISSVIVDLVDLMCSGSYELMEMTLLVLEAPHHPLDTQTKASGIAILQRCTERGSLQDWQREMVGRAIELLEAYPTRDPAEHS